MVQPTTVHILCTYTPSPGKGDQFRQILTQLAAKVQKEQSECIGYQIWEMKGEGEPIFKLLERWETQEALDRHLEHKWLQDFDNELDAISAKAQVVEPVEMVAGYAERQ
ncbi:hypothetical protein MMC13_003314 [Lambiella insularis]|nr:hypothetical protein [Lambiella insularis]